MRSKCAVVPKAQGENIRKKLSEDGVLRTDLRISRDEEFVYIPIAEGFDNDFKTTERDFEEIERTGDYKQFLDLPGSLMSLLPTSFDVIGDIHIIKLEDDLLPHSKEVAAAVMKAHSSAMVVALDLGVEGEFRTRKLEIIGGEDRTRTTHKEYGLTFELDVASVYFSPRLATERKRIADLVHEGERIIDMFAGVGPFSLLIAKRSSPEIIYAIDKNPEAITYMIENIKKNKIKNIAPMLGDARSLAASLKKADRIIMNLPHSSLDFLEVGLSSVKPGGGIHLYIIAENDEVDEMMGKISSISEMAGVNTVVKNVQEVHTYSPSQCLYCFDLIIG
jgi:tRNA (guanine37-N1)-methyltransferase